MSDLQNSLDKAIRDSEIKGDSSKYGYQIQEKTYVSYMSNNTWHSFLLRMSKLHKAQFNDGDGGELKEKKWRGDIYLPPKMASYGSSSRMIYNLSKDIVGFEFEKHLPTRVGHTAKLDGFYNVTDRDIYIEAKCREIYTSHTKIEINSVYKTVYDFIKRRHNLFDVVEPSNNEEVYKCTFKYGGTTIKHFDIKQLICHFLGIAANVLENDNYRPILFIYLIYNPNEVKDLMDNKKDEIISAYKDTLDEIERFGKFDWLFDDVIRFQEENLGLRRKENLEFELILADQSGYKKLIK